ncbi:hypothetical protein [Chitinophaga sp. sic0106]|uniref:hypothetical protein n=1 Tax=Chitinophaga sp. sic0106 TaxID=2854785 RepID=UPI001C471DD9|nr:hypothetical protein [Chitinophaga sp. sic0106]MBV7533050.1 hypothetical protein [Chitinophaga sp. sic0106]
MKKTKNVLSIIHNRLTKHPINFRERVCKECGWSVPTFYRKLRLKDIPDKEAPFSITSALSNAEKDKIVQVLEQEQQDLQRYLTRIKKRHKI